MQKRYRRWKVSALAVMAVAPLARAQSTRTWTGNGGDNLWTELLNWDTGVPISGDTGLFNGAGNGNLSISLGGVAQPIKAISFNSGAAAYNLGVTVGDGFNFDPAGAITVGSGVATAEIISASVLANGALLVTNGGTGGLALGGNVTFNAGGTLTVTNAVSNSTTTLGGNITQAGTNVGSLSLLTGAGVTNTNFIITGTNSFSGGTTIQVNTGSGGNIQIGSDSALGSGKVTVNIVTGTGSPQWQAINGTRTVANAFDLNSGLTFTGTNAFVFTGPMTIINASGTSRTINSSVSGNVVTFGSAASASTITLGNPADGVGKTVFFNAANGAKLIVNDALRDAAGGGGASSGGVTPTGGGTVVFSGQSTYSGTTSLSGSGTIVQVGASSVFAGNTVVSGPFGVGILLANNSTNSQLQAVGADQTVANQFNLITGFTVTNAPTNGYNVDLTGPHNLTLSGPVVFTATSSRTAALNTPGRTFTLGLPSAPSTITLATTNTLNLAIAVAPLGTTVINDVIQDGGPALAVPDTITYSTFGSTGFGTLRLTGANTYAGDTILNGGAASGQANVQIGVSSVTSGSNIVSGPFGKGILTINNSVAPPVLQPFGADRTIANPINLITGFFASNITGTPYNLSLTGPISLSNTNRVITNNMAPGVALSLGAAGAPSTLTLAAELAVQSQSTSGSTVVINDLISDAASTGSLLVENNAIVQLTNAGNTYSGGSTVNTGGILSISSNGSLGNATAGVNIGDATLLSTGTFSSARTFNLTGTNTGSTIDAAAGKTLTLTGTLTDGGSLVKGTNLGTVQLAQPAGYTATANVSVNGGVLAIGSTPGGATGPLNVPGVLTVASGAKVLMLPNPTASITHSVNSVVLNGTGQLDLANHNLLTATPSTTVRQYLTTGYAGGAWNGPGIASSSAAADANVNGQRALGYADGADGVVTGLAAGQTLVKSTQYGDTNLDGKVNNADFTNLSFNYGATTGATWDQGDFNYDGKINNADFTALSFNYGQTLSAGSPNVAATSAAQAIHATLTASPSAGTPADGTMEIDIDASTGDVKLVANNVNLGNYDLIAIHGDFDPNKWNMITTAGTNSKKFTVSTAQSANELQQGVLGKTNGVTLTGTYDLGNILPAGMTEAQYLADILDPNTPSQYAIGTTAKLVTPSVFVTSGVPEPTCLALGGVAAVGLLGRKRRR